MDLPAHSVYVIADAAACPDDKFLQRCRQAAAAGPAAVQLRARERSGAKVHRRAAALRRITTGKGTRFLINDRIDVAMAVRADGVHLGQRSLPPEAARRLLGPERLIGVSVHDRREAEEAVAGGADYLLASPVFATSSKPDAIPRGTGWFAGLQRRLDVPVIPLGGIDPDTAKALRGVTAHGAAALSAVMAASDPGAAVRQLRRSLTHASGSATPPAATTADAGRDDG